MQYLFKTIYTSMEECNGSDVQWKSAMEVEVCDGRMQWKWNVQWKSAMEMRH